MDKEIKQGYLAQKYVLVVAKNLKLLFKGSPPCKLATYNTDFPQDIVSPRRNEGLAQLPCLTLTVLSYASTRKQMEFSKMNKIAHVPHSGKRGQREESGAA